MDLGGAQAAHDDPISGLTTTTYDNLKAAQGVAVVTLVSDRRCGACDRAKGFGAGDRCAVGLEDEVDHRHEVVRATPPSVRLKELSQATPR